jgi:hypothetical protein
MTTSRREQLELAAKKLQAAKEDSLTALLDAEEATAEAEEKLAAAHTRRTQRVREAIKAGWTETELTTIGFTLGDAPKAARKTRTKKAAVPPVQGSSPAPAAGADVTT